MNLNTAIYPYAGPCAFCGRPDKRHRIFDSVRECVRAGDPDWLVAEDFDLTVEAVRWIVAQKRFPARIARRRKP